VLNFKQSSQSIIKLNEAKTFADNRLSVIKIHSLNHVRRRLSEWNLRFFIVAWNNLVGLHRGQS